MYLQSFGMCRSSRFVGGQNRVLGENDALISELQELPPRAFLNTEK